MGQTVEDMIAGGIQALVDRDSDQARRVMDQDARVDQLERENDDVCLRLLARWNAGDTELRFITTALKVVTDLERIGDLAAHIGRRALELNAEPDLAPHVDLSHMGALARWMVHHVLEAFLSGDVDVAREVIEQDVVLDGFHTRISAELESYMMQDPRNIHAATRVQSIARSLERIGDHATNVAEMVVFMTRGEDIRHQGRKRRTEH